MSFWRVLAPGLILATIAALIAMLVLHPSIITSLLSFLLTGNLPYTKLYVSPTIMLIIWIGMACWLVGWIVFGLIPDEISEPEKSQRPVRRRAARSDLDSRTLTRTKAPVFYSETSAKKTPRSVRRNKISTPARTEA